MECGLLGRKLSHSYSPQIHSYLGDYNYKICETELENLADIVNNQKFSGFNVTIPYKTEVISYCKSLSPVAKAVGSVNTLVRGEDGSLWGHNTDAEGFLYMVNQLSAGVKNKKVMVLGNGGASLSVCYVLREQGAKEILIVSRKGELNYSNAYEHNDVEIIVNTTPVGMYPNCGVSPIDLEKFPKCKAVLDLIYNPEKTALMLQAETLGINAIGGLSMLVAQAVASSIYFNGKPAKEGITEKVIQLLSAKMKNIILVGMPSSGKTTIGKALANKLGRKFVDADEDLEKTYNKSIPDIFAKEGEIGFREKEKCILAKLGKESGMVIATGGGCVTVEDNYNSLHQNGVIVWIKRELHLLKREGRPLSLNADLSKMYEIRSPLYKKFADIVIENNKKQAEIVDILEDKLNEFFSY